jgi:uncharacterized protein (DUF1919 family)
MAFLCLNEYGRTTKEQIDDDKTLLKKSCLGFVIYAYLFYIFKILFVSLSFSSHEVYKMNKNGKFFLAVGPRVPSPKLRNRYRLAWFKV